MNKPNMNYVGLIIIRNTPNQKCWKTCSMLGVRG